MNKKNIKLWCEIIYILIAATFSVIGIWSDIKAFIKAALFMWIVFLMGGIFYCIKNGRIKHI